MTLKFTVIRSQLLTAVLFTSLFTFLSQSSQAQYTNTYNGKSYSSTQPYNLTIAYFVPSDVPLDPTYKKRLSALMLWARNFYRQSMIINGYGDRTFGLFTETAAPDSVEIILINGLHPTSAYPYSDMTPERTEVLTYFANHPEQKSGDHILILTAINNIESPHVPFYGDRPLCFALDYPQLDIQYMGQTGYWGDKFNGWFGGMMHELGHGLNLHHSHETASEHFNPVMGTNIMGIGNTTLGHSATFVNHAACSVLDNCQAFATTPGQTYYNGHQASLTTPLNIQYSNGNITVAGKYASNRRVTAINFYQDPHASDHPWNGGYYEVAWSVNPIGSDSFYVSMPVSEITDMGGIYPFYHLADTTRTYRLDVELVFANGEQETVKEVKFDYMNGIPHFSDATSIGDVSAQNAVQFFPNPVKDELNIRVCGEQKISGVAVFDLYGRRILIQNNSPAILNMKAMPPGVYIVEVQLKNGELMRKKISKM